MTTMVKKTGFEKVMVPAVRKDRTLPSNVWFCLCSWRDDSRPGILSGREVSNDWLIFILELFLNCTVASVNHELCGLRYCCSGAKSCLTLWTPWTVARQAPLSFTISQSLRKFMSVESVMPSNHLILCCPLFPFAFSLSQNQGLLQWVGSLHQVAKVITFPHLAPTPKFPIAIIYKKWCSILPMTLCHKPQACRRYWIRAAAEAPGSKFQ